MGLPFKPSHRRKVLSSEPETRRRPSGLKATEFTQPLWPFRGEPIGLPLKPSHRRRVLSMETETRRCPSGLKATEFTQPLWP